MAKTWSLAHGRTLEVGQKSLIMGVLNVTPDSFSDGGAYSSLEAAVKQAEVMIEAGADIIDVGGESTRPGAEPVTMQEEQDRVLPVIQSLAHLASKPVISVDTYRADTARLAVEAGAHIVNDVWGLQREPGIAAVAAQSGAGLVIMHTSRNRDCAPDPIDDQRAFLNLSLKIAEAAGVKKSQIALDPGFGFGKEAAECLALCARFSELSEIGRPLLAGTSRKRFLGAATGIEDAAQRDGVTAASSAILRMAGADIFRVHDVAGNRAALNLADAVRLA